MMDLVDDSPVYLEIMQARFRFFYEVHERILEAPGDLVLEDGVLGGALQLSMDPPAALSARPHKTVSQSEDGFEKIMQAVTLKLAWPLSELNREMVLTLEIRRG